MVAVDRTIEEPPDQCRRRLLLLLLSDGKPNDVDDYEGRYGLEDMRQALRTDRRRRDADRDELRRQVERRTASLRRAKDQAEAADRAKSRFLRLVTLLGTRLQAEGQWAQAVEVYERGLEVDSLAEPLYQHLMLCLQQQGQHAEVLRSYRRCRDLLSIVLGVRPARHTEQIRLASAQAGALATPGVDLPGSGGG